jgi:hypothetical protein
MPQSSSDAATYVHVGCPRSAQVAKWADPQQTVQTLSGDGANVGDSTRNDRSTAYVEPIGLIQRPS